MASQRHRKADLNGLEVWMLISFSGGTPSLTRASGDTFQDADITLTDTGTGDIIVTINPFKGPKGEVYGVATTQTISTFANITALTYTGNSLAVTVKIEDDASTATDANVFLHLYAE